MNKIDRIDNVCKEVVSIENAVMLIRDVLFDVVFYDGVGADKDYAIERLNKARDTILQTAVWPVKNKVEKPNNTQQIKGEMFC